MIILRIKGGMIVEAVRDQSVTNSIHLYDEDDEQPSLRYLPIKHDKKRLEELRAINNCTTKITLTWQAGDIKQAYENMLDDRKIPENTEPLTNEEIGEVLDNLEDHHDCEYGISWRNVEAEIEDILQDRV